MQLRIDDIIEQEPFGGYQKLILVLISLAVIVDGFDIQMIAFVSPVLMEEWNVGRGDIATAVSAALAGMAIGAPLGGWLGDRWGRRRAILSSVIFFGLATLPVAFVSNITELATLRFIAGLGFGALLPNATTLIAEWMPKRVRSFAISLMIVGVPVGGMLGAAVSRWLIANAGWQACFVAAGLLGLLLGALLFALLPESPKFAAKTSEAGRGVLPLLNRAFGAGRFDVGATYLVAEGARGNWADIFAAGHRRVTAGLALAFFANLLVFYAFVNWLPSILTSRGLSLDTALRGAMYFNLCGLAGAVIAAWLVSRAGSRIGLLALLGGGLGSSAALGAVMTAPELHISYMMLCLSAAGACLAGLQVALYTLAAGAYATECRSTGVGFAAGCGRLGPIVSAIGGGMILDRSDALHPFFITAFGALLFAMVGVLLVDRHTSPAPRDRS